jgi:signal transduction histidine kinase
MVHLVALNRFWPEVCCTQKSSDWQEHTGMPHIIADRLRRKAPEILTRWQARACKEVGSALKVTSLVLQDHFQALLDLLADALSKTVHGTQLQVAHNRGSALEFAKLHGDSRAPLSYTLAEIVLESQIMRQVVLEVLEEEEPLPIPDRDIILKVFDQTVRDTAVRFADIQNDIQEQFSLTLVHDLRTPATVAKLGAQIIKGDSTASETSVLTAGRIEGNMDRLEGMLRQLLDVSRIRSGAGLSFELEETRLDEVARDVVQEMNLIHGDRVQIQADQSVTGKWNRDGLYRAIENLVVNALKYGSPDSPVKVIIKQNDTTASITVHNDGNPIPSSEQPTLFKKFVQGSNVTNETGWGLGLALVSGVAKAHDGTVRVESSNATGTDFIIELPKTAAEKAPPLISNSNKSAAITSSKPS